MKLFKGSYRNNWYMEGAKNINLSVHSILPPPWDGHVFVPTVVKSALYFECLFGEVFEDSSFIDE